MKKIKNLTLHSYERLIERTPFPKNEFKNISNWAIKNGLDLNTLPNGELKEYMVRRKIHKNKRVKLYRGYVFIFFRNSRRMITCYKLPEQYEEEYNNIINKKTS